MSGIRSTLLLVALAIGSATALAQQAAPSAAASAPLQAESKAKAVDCSKLHNHAVEKGATVASTCVDSAASAAKPAHSHQKFHKQG